MTFQPPTWSGDSAHLRTIEGTLVNKVTFRNVQDISLNQFVSDFPMQNTQLAWCCASTNWLATLLMSTKRSETHWSCDWLFQTFLQLWKMCVLFSFVRFTGKVRCRRKRFLCKHRAHLQQSHCVGYLRTNRCKRPADRRCLEPRSSPRLGCETCFQACM